MAYDSATGDITPDSQLPAWVFTDKLVVKPDQLIKRRGKAGLLFVIFHCTVQGELLLIFCGVRSLLNKEWAEGKEWIKARAGKQVQVRPLYLVAKDRADPRVARSRRRWEL